LKQIDNNGKFTYSSVVAIKPDQTTLDISTLYPNPVSNEMNIKVDAPTSGAATVSINDVSGKIIASYPIQVSEGSNNFTFQVNALKKGSYFVRFITDKGISKVMKFEKK
jgi:hypothetical protein